jgi:integrase
MGVYVKGNRWFIDYYINGRRKREVVGHVDKITRTQAEKALKARAGEIVQGKFNLEVTKKPMRMNALFDRFLEWAKTNYKNPAKTASAVKPLRAFFGGRLISETNLWLVDRYKAHRKAEQKKPETINRELGILRRMLHLAIEWKLITATPIKGLTLVKIPKYFPRVLSVEEFERLYSSASVHFKPVLLCAYLTGMRKGEIARLMWEDVDLKDRYLIVKESKNGESRTIPLHSRLISTLLELKDKSENPYVFTTPEGNAYISDSAWKRAFYTALKKSGIGKCRFHDLRHSFCSNLIVGEKEDFVTVMELTGHKDMRMLKRYSHTRESAKRSAIDKLGNRLNLIVMDTPLDTKPKTTTLAVPNFSVVSGGI